MKTYSLITIKFGEGLITFANGIMEFFNEDNLKVLVEKSAKNLSSLLEAGVTFITLEKSYRFYVNWEDVVGVNV